MSSFDITDRDDTPSVEVRAYRQGELIATNLCLTSEEAAALVASLEETPGVTCEVDDLATPSYNHSAAEVEPQDQESGYDRAVEAEY